MELTEIEKEKLKQESKKALDSIDWEALANGESQHFNEETGLYEGSGEFRQGKIERFNKINDVRLKAKQAL